MRRLNLEKCGVSQLVMRSILFVPATRSDRFAKALTSGADAVCVDLEDAVPLPDKPLARRNVSDFLLERGTTKPSRLIRLNAIDTDDGAKDLELLSSLETPPDALVLPKVTSVDQITEARDVTGVKQVIATVETAAGLEAATDIASAPGVIAIAFGSADYSAEAGCTMEWDSLVYGRGRIVQAAAFGGVHAIDGAWLDIRDEAGLFEETRRLPAIGFDGRVVIHPTQVGPVNDAFLPAPEQVAEAKKIVEADKAAGGGVLVVSGRMIDPPVVEQARRIVAIAELTA